MILHHGMHIATKDNTHTHTESSTPAVGIEIELGSPTDRSPLAATATGSAKYKFLKHGELRTSHIIFRETQTT